MCRGSKQSRTQGGAITHASDSSYLDTLDKGNLSCCYPTPLGSACPPRLCLVLGAWTVPALATSMAQDPPSPWPVLSLEPRALQTESPPLLQSGQRSLVLAQTHSQALCQSRPSPWQTLTLALQALAITRRPQHFPRQEQCLGQAVLPQSAHSRGSEMAKDTFCARTPWKTHTACGFLPLDLEVHSSVTSSQHIWHPIGYPEDRCQERTQRGSWGHPCP